MNFILLNIFIRVYEYHKNHGTKLQLQRISKNNWTAAEESCEFYSDTNHGQIGKQICSQEMNLGTLKNPIQK